MCTKSMIRVGLMCGILCGTVGTASMLGGCDRKVVETVKTKDGPNGSKTEKTTVVEHNDGTVSEEKKTQSTEVH